MKQIIAADTGGTFTDLAAYDLETQTLVCTKSLTTYERLVRGVMNCVAKAGLGLADVETVKHGTTLVINTFLQRNGARTALVTTAGFRDMLELRRGNRPVPFRLDFHRDPELVPRDLRFEVPERIDGQGNVLEPLDVTAVRDVALRLQSLGVEAIAVSFLNSYANPQHETAAATILRAELPGVYVTTGTELTREWYEYERTATAAANAYVGPTLEVYANDFVSELESNGFHRRLYMMASNGGVYSVDRARREPVMLVESGPVGGAIGAAVYARELGLANAIAFDMGGTTAKCALVEGGRFEVKSPYYIGGYETGFPVRGAVLDIVEVGAGGGSIASLDRQRRLHVGPRSAGSTPGPVCYGRGGREPTVTDANLVLSRIDDANFLGGEMRLDTDAARRAIRLEIADPLGLIGAEGVDQAALGILALSAARMSGAVKEITLQRGLDPRDFALMVFGGGGALHGVQLARELHIPLVIVPPHPGNFSAVGMLLAGVRIDSSQTFLRRFSPASVREMESLFTELECRAVQTVQADTGSDRHIAERFAELRYVGQRHSLRTPLGSATNPDELRLLFDTTYKKRYGHADAGADIEFVSIVSSVSAPSAPVDLAKVHPIRADASGRPRAHRNVHFGTGHGRIDAPVYDRRNLPIGFESSGPAIIEEYGTTTIVGPADRFVIGRLGEVRIYFR